MNNYDIIIENPHKMFTLKDVPRLDLAKRYVNYTLKNFDSTVKIFDGSGALVAQKEGGGWVL